MFFALIVLVFVLVLYISTQKPKNYPPGPPRLPLLGYLPFLSRHLPHKNLRDLSDKYGPIVGIYIAMRRCVILNDHESIKEALMNDDLLGRPTGHLITSRTWGKRLGVLFTEGPFWLTQRRFTLHQFRNLGFGKRTHELVIHEDLADLVGEIKALKGSFNIQKVVGVSSINILWTIMGGASFKRDDQRLQVLIEKINKLFQSGSPFGNLAAVIPILRPFLAEYTGYNDILRGFVSVRDFIMESVEEHKKTLKLDEVRDFFDAYLIEMKSSDDPSFTEEQLVALCMDIFSAGVETSSSLISFCILFMCLYPEIQSNAQKEIDSVVGSARLPCMNDRTSLPYVDAVYTEVFRFRCPAATTVPHFATSDTTIQGYNIPKGTMILPNLYAIFMNKDCWGDPECFRPERFLDESRKFKKEEIFLPFGKGKRSCLGESLARMTTFLTFATLLQNFKFRLDPNSFNNDTEGSSGFTLGPPYFEVFAEPRI